MNYTSVFEIVKLHTFYHNDKYLYYLSLHNLLSLCQTIDSEVKNNGIALPNYIRIIPHYNNMNLDFRYQRIELDEYKLYIECRDVVTEEIKSNFLTSCHCDEDFWELKTPEVEKICINLIQKNDSMLFLKALRDYFRFVINDLVPKISLRIKELTNESAANLSIGEFSFEIHCD